jgi:amino acid transporter
MAATRTIYRFFAFGGVEMLFLQNFNNLKMGVTLTWLAVLAPVQGTLLAVFKIAKHFHMISHHPESKHRSAKICITSLMLCVLLGYVAWLVTVFGQMTSDVPQIEANYSRDHYDCDAEWPLLCEQDWMFWIIVVGALVGMSVLCCICCCFISCCCNKAEDSEERPLNESINASSDKATNAM